MPLTREVCNDGPFLMATGSIWMTRAFFLGLSSSTSHAVIMWVSLSPRNRSAVCRDRRQSPMYGVLQTYQSTPQWSAQTFYKRPSARDPCTWIASWSNASRGIPWYLVTRVQYGIKPVVADRGRSGDDVRSIHGRLDELEAACALASTGRCWGRSLEAPASAVEAHEPVLDGNWLELRVVVDGMQLSEHASPSWTGRLYPVNITSSSSSSSTTSSVLIDVNKIYQKYAQF